MLDTSRFYDACDNNAKDIRSDMATIRNDEISSKVSERTNNLKEETIKCDMAKIFITLPSHFLRIMRSIVANYVPNFQFPLETGRWHFISFDSDGEPR